MRKLESSEDIGNQWVTRGRITFYDYSTKHRPNNDYALRSINIEIEPGEKIGVVGWTGAGKSTLFLAICRFLEASYGFIEIDGVDISEVGIADLRDSITVIPQEASIFENTLRFNLDPDDLKTDEEIIELLNRASLSNLVSRNAKGLNADIRESDLSLGEKQLICIWRAILRVSDSKYTQLSYRKRRLF